MFLVVRLLVVGILATLLLWSPVALAAQQLPVDPAIQGEEREVISRVIASLRPEDRRNVIYISRGNRVYVNRPQLRREVDFLTVIGMDLYQNSEGDEFVVPPLELQPQPDQVSPVCQGSSGPFHRVHSVPYFQGMQSYVNLSGNPPVTVSSSETPYILGGGWGGNGGAVDAGWQYNRRRDNWSLYLLEEGTRPLTLGRFLKDQVALFKVYVPVDNRITLYGRARDLQGLLMERTIVKDVNPAWGWQRGVATVVKRVTSIAQRTQNFQSGAYFVTIWDEYYLFDWPGYAYPWTSGYTGGECMWPDAQRVIVTDYTAPPCIEPPSGHDDCILVRITLPRP